MRYRDDRRLAAAIRAIRRRQRLRQQDVAERSGVGQSTMSRLELGYIDGMTVGTLREIAEALGARIHIELSWRGAASDRLLDEGHSRLGGAMAQILTMLDWDVHAEVTYAHFGERGSVDLLAWHAASRSVLVVEAKTELGSLEELGRRLDQKVRLAPNIAIGRFGWKPLTVARLVVITEERSNRRAVERHAAFIQVAFPSRNHAVRSWLREPRGTISGLLFLPVTQGAGVTRNPSAVERVRPTRSSVAPSIGSREVSGRGA